MRFVTQARWFPRRMILGGGLAWLGSALSDLNALGWIVIGKLLWFAGTGLWLCTGMARLRQQDRLSPILRTFILGALVFAAGVVMVSLWDAWQAELTRSAPAC